MAGPYEATDQLLDERPELEDVLETLVTLDSEGPWTFEDVGCDSGAFGELVSREFVRSVDEGYRLVDREATRAALHGETYSTTDDGVQSGTTDEPAKVSSPLPAVRSRIRGRLADANTTFVATLGFSLFLLFVMRTIRYREIFRGDHVVLTGNDPYVYRYMVDQLLVASPGLFDFGGIAEVLGRRASSGEPFTMVLGWWATVIFEFSPETTGITLAWLPVVATLLVGVLVAWMALAVTDDERVAVLAVTLLAVTPANATYTGLGFFDHHPFDFLWLATMAACLVWLGREFHRAETGIDHLRTPKTWGVTGLFGLAATAAVFTWNGSPILFAGVGVYAVLRPDTDLRAGRSPLVGALPLVVALVVATVPAHLLHTGAGWQTAAVVYVPAILAGVVLGAALVSEGVRRVDLNNRLGIGSTVGVGVLAVVAVRLLTPGFFDHFRTRLVDDLLGRTEAVETKGLFVPELSVTFGPLEQFGVLLVFALPVLGWAVIRCARRPDPAWTVIVSFSLPLLGFATIQRRFAGELSMFVAIMAAVGLLWALSWLDLSYRPFDTAGRTSFRPSRLRDGTQALYLSFILLVVVTVGLVFSVGVLGTLTMSDGEYEAAAWIGEDNDDGDIVLSRWGRSRMYNYFADSDAVTYGFARQNYTPFLESDDPDEWYSRLDGVGYVVVEDFDLGTIQANSTYAKLRLALGSASEQNAGVGHYQFGFLSADESVSVFRVVDGAVIEGNASAGEVVTVSTTVEFSDAMAERIGGKGFTYRRTVTADENGTFAVRVSYPGEYAISTGENVTVSVTDGDISDGQRVEVEEESS
jgi:dolichyl-diphosphooligosaccharide--protein glycosyltransferase